MLRDHPQKSSTLFISHASKDREYVKELVTFLNLLQIKNIVCSSLEDYQIPNDVDIYEYLKERINEDGRVMFILSENYYGSAACLNEMGACWVLNKKYTTILTPNFNFEQIQGAINPNQMSFKINDEGRLKSLLTSLHEEFGTENSFPQKEVLDVVLSQTIKNINIISFKEKVLKESISYSIESRRNVNGKLRVVIRLKNPMQKKLVIENIIVEFEDANNNILRAEKNINLVMYGEENKVEYFDLDYGESKYNPYDFLKNEKVDFKFYIDAQ